MAERIKGQEVSITFIEGGKVVHEVNDVQSADVEFQMEILSEGFLGETTDRKDDVFRGVSGRVTIHLEDSESLSFFHRLIARSRRHIDTFHVHMYMTLDFPSSGDPVLVLYDIRFGAIPLSMSDRASYTTVDLEFECSDYAIA